MMVSKWTFLFHGIYFDHFPYLNFGGGNLWSPIFRETGKQPPMGFVDWEKPSIKSAQHLNTKVIYKGAAGLNAKAGEFQWDCFKTVGKTKIAGDMRRCFGLLFVFLELVGVGGFSLLEFCFFDFWCLFWFWRCVRCVCLVWLGLVCLFVCLFVPHLSGEGC